MKRKFIIGQDKKDIFFSYFSTKCVEGTHQKYPGEVLLMSTHNICFLGKIRKILYQYILVKKVPYLGLVKSHPSMFHCENS